MNENDPSTFAGTAILIGAIIVFVFLVVWFGKILFNDYIVSKAIQQTKADQQKKESGKPAKK